MDVNQLRQGLMMLNNEKIVRELYAAAEGSGKDIAKLVSFFSDEGYMCDIPSGLKLHGQAIGDAIDAFAREFPDVHRELFNIYVAENVVEGRVGWSKRKRSRITARLRRGLQTAFEPTRRLVSHQGIGAVAFKTLGRAVPLATR